MILIPSGQVMVALRGVPDGVQISIFLQIFPEEFTLNICKRDSFFAKRHDSIGEIPVENVSFRVTSNSLLPRG
jgi:hypothetical protein